MVFGRLVERKMLHNLAELLEKEGFKVVVEPKIEGFRYPDMIICDKTGKELAIVESKREVSTYTIVWLKEIADILNTNIKIIILFENITKDAHLLAKKLKNVYLINIRNKNLHKIASMIKEFVSLNV
ncbi:hypothetical protein [Archaeoglobus sp.]